MVKHGYRLDEIRAMSGAELQARIDAIIDLSGRKPKAATTSKRFVARRKQP